MPKEVVIENAVIESAELGFQDHGILTGMLRMRHKSGNYGFGGLHWGSREGASAEQCRSMRDWVASVLLVTGAKNLSDVVGKIVRVKRLSEMTTMKITEIGHVIDDVWMAAP